MPSTRRPPQPTETSILVMAPEGRDHVLASLLGTSQLASTPLGPCRITWAHNGHQALQTLSAIPFEACVVDSGLGTTSIDFVRAARARGWRRPLVFCTRPDDHGLQSVAHSAGASDVMSSASLSPSNLGRVLQAAIQRSRFEETLRFGEEMVRILVEGTRDHAICMLDREGRILTWNQGAERLTGYAPLDVVGHHTAMLYAQRDRETLHPAQILRHAVSHGRHEEDSPRLRKDGTQFWANAVVTPLYGEDGHLRGFAQVTRDITRQRAREAEGQEREAQGQLRAVESQVREAEGAERELEAAGREAESRQREVGYQEVERIARMGSWRWESAGHRPEGLMHWSPNTFRLLGLPPGPVDANTYLAAVHPEDRAGLAALAANLRTSALPLQHEHRIVRPDGTSARMRATVTTGAWGKGRSEVSGTLQQIGPNQD